jgi:hypothetical protein
MSRSVLLRAACAVTLMAGLATLASCGRVASSSRVESNGISGAEASQVIDDLVARAMAAYGVADAAVSQDGASEHSATVTIDEPVNQSSESSLGGRITVTGRVTGTATPADKAVSLVLDATETISDYKFESSGVTYVVTGAPNVAATGAASAKGSANLPTMRLTLKGTFTISRSGVSRICPLAVDIQTGPDGTGEMKGTVCGDRVRRTM